MASTVTFTGGNLTPSAGTTGSGLAVAQNSPTLIDPVLGDAEATSLGVAGNITSNGVITNAAQKNEQVALDGNGTTYSIAKSVSGSSAATFVQITVPATACYLIIECFLTVSRGAGSDKGTSLIKKAYFSIARNGSGTDVVLDGNLLTTAEQTTTTAGGSNDVVAATGAMTIVRNGAEANTAPQVVNLTVNPIVGATTGRAVVLSSIILQGVSTGFVIA